MKHNHELVAQLQLPEGKAARKIKGQIVIVSVSPKKEIKVEKQDETQRIIDEIEARAEKKAKVLMFTIRPWGCANEYVGTDGSDRDLLPRTSKNVLGKWGKANTAVEYTITVPDDYSHKIFIVAKDCNKKIITVLYSPDGKVDQLLPRNQ